MLGNEKWWYVVPMTPRNKPVYGTCSDIPSIGEHPIIGDSDDHILGTSDNLADHRNIQDADVPIFPNSRDSEDDEDQNNNDHDDHEDEDNPSTEPSLDLCIELASHLDHSDIEDIEMYIDIGPFEAIDSILDNLS